LLSRISAYSWQKGATKRATHYFVSMALRLFLTLCIVLGVWFEIQSSIQNAMNHGGKRPGAGRKAGARALVTRSRSENVLATVNEEDIWQRLLRNRNARIVLDTLKYLTDRRDGKAVRAFEVSGPDGGPMDLWKMTDEQLDQRIKELQAGLKAADDTQT
jgi:hypothetical protein